MKETIKIEGMSCGGCVNGVRHALTELPLTQLMVEIGKAQVVYDETKVTHQQIVDRITALGYEVTGTESMAA